MQNKTQHECKSEKYNSIPDDYKNVPTTKLNAPSAHRPHFCSPLAYKKKTPPQIYRNSIFAGFAVVFVWVIVKYPSSHQLLTGKQLKYLHHPHSFPYLKKLFHNTTITTNASAHIAALTIQNAHQRGFRPLKNPAGLFKNAAPFCAFPTVPLA